MCKNRFNVTRRNMQISHLETDIILVSYTLKRYYLIKNQIHCRNLVIAKTFIATV